MIVGFFTSRLRIVASITFTLTFTFTFRLSNVAFITSRLPLDHPEGDVWGQLWAWLQELWPVDLVNCHSSNFRSSGVTGMSLIFSNWVSGGLPLFLLLLCLHWLHSGGGFWVLRQNRLFPPKQFVSKRKILLLAGSTTCLREEEGWICTIVKEGTNRSIVCKKNLCVW